MTTTICMINQKGGCGKSSTCFHLSGAFASFGMRVLLIDADPQGSLSQGFLGPAKVENLTTSQTIAALFDESLFFMDQRSLIVESSIPSISLCPANQTLAPFNSPNPESTGTQQHALREFIAEVGGEYDIVLIDCPPNLYRCSWTAMIASNHVVIPVPPEDFGTQGLRAVHQTIEQARKLNPSLRRLGHLITRHDRRLAIHCEYANRLRKHYGEMVLETVINELSAFKVSLSFRQPVEFSDPKSDAAKMTRELAREILYRTTRESIPTRAA